ncbi:MAG: hypothetical protein M0P92_04650 [Acholeplasmataceae bacterium]|nr:hypothetical protein [Acholeplasmataceae bacterium]
MGVKQAEIITDPHPRKTPNTVKAWLIVAIYNKKGGFFYFFANFKNSSEMTKGFLGEKVINVGMFYILVQRFICLRA